MILSDYLSRWVVWSPAYTILRRPLRLIGAERAND
jgi:hypothetical protein